MVDKITFGDFDSEKLNLILTKRTAPLPEEKRIIENIPFSDGVQDYSQIFGKFFNEREVTYTFSQTNLSYEECKKLEYQINHLLTPYGYQELYDTHDRGYYFKARFKNTSFNHDPQTNTLTCQIYFNAQPYLYRNNDSYDDVWDSFNFNIDIAQIYDFVVNYELKATIIIPKHFKVEPVFELLEGDVTVYVNGYVLKLKKGKNKTPYVVFDKVTNEITFKGDGKVQIHYDRGEMR